MEDLRLIANPHLLANTKKNNISDINFIDKLKLLLREEYNNIYLSDPIIYKIKSIIDEEIYLLRINQIITECLNSYIDQVIEENKFDFCLPFD
tara:strand:- start:54 stop:332 length:279 start_codon:yes stop_codon:yes gene_type:complete